MGGALVALQFGLMLVLALLAAAQFQVAALPVAAMLPALACLVLTVWTLWHNRLDNFNIHPAPKDGARLITTGPYRWIRHPMYSALLLGAAALAWAAGSAIAWSAWGALAIVLLVKSGLEERWLRQVHPGYAAYVTRSKGFLPWLF